MTPKRTLFPLLLILITISLACNLPAIIERGSGKGISDGLTENYSPSPANTISNPFNYSPDQIGVINTYGNPTRFLIIFTDTIRQETWSYDTIGYTVVFGNGVKLAEKIETPQYQEGLYSTTLEPNQFYRGMGIDEVVLSTGRSDLHLITLDGLEKESHLMHLRGISVGLVEGQVNFIETIPAMTEYLLVPEDFSPLAPLTAEELANEGTHLYQSISMFPSGTIENEPISWNFRFEGSAVYLSLAGYEEEEIKYSNTGPNQYYKPADDQLEETTLTFNLDGFVQVAVVEGEQVQVIHTIDGGIEMSQ